ncbi:DNA repair protein rad8 [Colletotrichum musicola]|uniref:DNA repair protein rad8 n=1 Tax=Colletotrichum musicola TaxID=2175873 RepID=A0A8H6KQH4_9PEZI|nr:DNA repair protein rad8 [Colletotrichum musicola]
MSCEWDPYWDSFPVFKSDVNRFLLEEYVRGGEPLAAPQIPIDPGLEDMRLTDSGNDLQLSGAGDRYQYQYQNQNQYHYQYQPSGPTSQQHQSPHGHGHGHALPLGLPSNAPDSVPSLDNASAGVDEEGDVNMSERFPIMDQSLRNEGEGNQDVIMSDTVGSGHSFPPGDGQGQGQGHVQGQANIVFYNLEEFTQERNRMLGFLNRASQLHDPQAQGGPVSNTVPEDLARRNAFVRRVHALYVPQEDPDIAAFFAEFVAVYGVPTIDHQPSGINATAPSMANDASAAGEMAGGDDVNTRRHEDDEMRHFLACFGDMEVMDFIARSVQFPPLPPQELNNGEILDERSVQHPRDSFPVLLSRALDLGLRDVLENGGAKFTIGTMCSGTDGPIMALEEFKRALPRFGLTDTLQFEHVFSVEIEPFKQSFISRNCRPTGDIFRNVTDLGRPGATAAMTASGVMKPVPDAPYILLAGSSCVDFSSLNTQKKKMAEASALKRIFEKQMAHKTNPTIAMQEDRSVTDAFDDFWKVVHLEGESIQTFFSIHQYARVHRPKIIILENVLGAPWKQITDFWLASIGYAATVIQADAKHFLVPQTRNRKYAIGFDARHYGLEEAKQMVEQWESMMGKSNWFANPPNMHAFMLQQSDPAVLQARFMCDRKLDVKPRKDHQAVMCMLDHAAARRTEGLGQGHPYTMNDGLGSFTPREEAWHTFTRSLTRRMKDLLDISYLRAEKQGFDFTWKTVILDLGQNVDRQTRKPGTAPCILPGAELFVSSYGRPIIGLEALQMQGIPLNCIKMSRETEKQLMSLAGNAMTTTVAGAAILSALVAERKHANISQGSQIDTDQFMFHGDDQPQNAYPILNEEFEPGRKAVLSVFHPNVAVFEVCVIAQMGRRYCLCEAYRKHHKVGTFYCCEFCGGIRCSSCLGNPKHHVDLEKPLKHDAVTADRNVARLKAIQTFPAHVLLSCSPLHSPVDHPQLPRVFRPHFEALNAAIAMCARDVNYYQTKIKFRDELTVTYEAKNSHIEVIATGASVTWSVYLREAFVDASQTEDCRQALRDLGYDFRKPVLRAELKDLNASFAPLLDPQGTAIGFTQTCTECPAYPDLATCAFLAEFTGNFEFTNKCATPGGLLYACKRPNSSPIYHMLDVNSDLDSATDRWIFTPNPSKLEHDQKRHLLLSMKQDYTHFCSNDNPAVRVVSGYLPGIRVGMSEQLGLQVGLSERLNQDSVKLRSLANQQHDINDCSVALQAMDMSLDIPDMRSSLSLPAINVAPGQTSWVAVPEQEYGHVFESVSFALNKIANCVENSHALAVDNIQLNADAPCAPCSPPLPQVHYIWNGDGTIYRVEDEKMAAVAARNLDDRRPPIELQARVERNTSLGHSKLHLRVFFNPASLSHRAFGNIPRNTDAMSHFVRSRDGTARFRVDFEFLDPSLKDLAPFRRNLVATTAEFPLAIGRQPPSFASNGMALRPDQFSSVSWMLQREKGTSCFTERETAEAILPAGNVRLSSTVEVANSTRGGVLAHEVGYGKTVVILGLLDYTSNQFAQAQSIAERQQWTQGNKMIHAKGTLVIVPSHIATQWANEAKRFLGRHRAVHVIRTPKDVVRSKIEHKDLVIVNDTLFNSSRYLTKTAAVCKMPVIQVGKADFNDRNFTQWKKEVLKTIDEAGFDHGNPNAMTAQQLDDTIQAYRDSTMDWAKTVSDQNVGSSSRKTQQTARGSGKGATATINSKTVQLPAADLLGAFKHGHLLEMYTFNRIVYDEFSYENVSLAAFFQQAIASSKWILSGTPPLSSLAQVCDIGLLLNTHVASAAPTPGYFPKVTTGPMSTQQTEAEEFVSYGETISAQLALSRHEQAQNFVDHFCRKNRTDVSNVKFDERICLVQLGYHEALLYNLAQQALCNAQWDLEELSDYGNNMIRSILDDPKESTNVTGKGAAKDSAKDAENESGSAIDRRVMDALLLRSSLPASYSCEDFQRMDWIPKTAPVGEEQEFTVNELAFGAKRASLEHYNRCCEILSSYVDLMMYLANVMDNDKTPRDGSRQTKEDSYMAHMREIIAIFQTQQAEAFGDGFCVYEVMNHIFHKIHLTNRAPLGAQGNWDFKTWSKAQGGPAAADCASWWPLEANHPLTNDDLQDLKHRLPDGPATKDEDVVPMIQAMQSAIEDDEIHFMSRDLGLKKDNRADSMAARLNRHLDGKSTDADFEFGVKLPHTRPSADENIPLRGQSVNEVLNYFILVIQAIRAGMKITIEAWRRYTFTAKAVNLMTKFVGPEDTRCNRCGKTTQSLYNGYLSVACGHTLCHDCHTLFIESGGQRCPFVGGCSSPSQGTFIPWHALVHEDYLNLDLELAELASRKVSRIADAIRANVQPGEKVLVFVAYDALKYVMYKHLNDYMPVRVYMTNGGVGDADQIEGFKRDPDSAILIQSLMSSESAGTNLTEANHVMFAGVLWTDRDNWSMYMDQAKGRAIRQGQQRTVHIYHFVTLATMEYEIANQRLAGGRLRNRGDEENQVFLPIPEDAVVSSNWPRNYRPWVEAAQGQRLLRSLETEEFESS